MANFRRLVNQNYFSNEQEPEKIEHPTEESCSLQPKPYPPFQIISRSSTPRPTVEGNVPGFMFNYASRATQFPTSFYNMPISPIDHVPVAPMISPPEQKRTELQNARRQTKAVENQGERTEHEGGSGRWFVEQTNTLLHTWHE
eukprot:gene20757-22783_t